VALQTVSATDGRRLELRRSGVLGHRDGGEGKGARGHGEAGHAGRSHTAMARWGVQAGVDSDELCQGRVPLVPAWSRHRRCACTGAHHRKGSTCLPSSPPLPFLHGCRGGGGVTGTGSAGTGRADASERERENGERGERGRVGAIIEGQPLSTVHFSHF
jgi:hypothetical protein